MDTNRLALIFVFFTNVGLGALVYLRGRKNAVNISFSILTSTIALWILSVFVMVSFWRSSNPIIWVRVAYATGTFTIASFLIFSAVFSYERPAITRKYIRHVIPTASILALISLSPLSVRKIIYENGAVVRTHYGIGNILWAIYAAVSWVLIFYNLWNKWKRGNSIEKLRIQYMFLGIVSTLTVIGLTNIFVPLILGYEGASGYGPCFTMILMGCTAYAIVKHRLMDIGVFIRKGIVYSLLLAGATLGVGLLVVGIPYLFPNLTKGHSAMVSFLGGLFIIFAVRPFGQNLKGLINAFILRDQYHSRRSLGNFTHQATRTLDMEGLLSLILNTAVETMKVGRASLWVLDSGTGIYRPRLLLGLKPEDLQLDLSDESKIVRYLEESREPIVKEELQRNLSLEDSDEIETVFRDLKAEISLPLFAEDQLIGILNLGSKSSGRIYYKEDIDLLETISDQSAIAIQNARLHQQVVNIKNYNETILENLTSGVIAIDTLSRITMANRAAARILGTESEDMSDTDIHNLPEYIRYLLTETLKSGSGFRDVERTIRTAAGKEEKAVLISTTILKDEKEQIVGALAVFSDISVLKAIEAEIHQTEKLSSLGRLAAELAHEIKNPLVTIKTSFELLMENQDGAELDRDFLSLAMSETDRINELIRRLLDLTRPAPPKLELCDINQVLDETSLILRTDMSDKNIEFLDRRGDDPIEIYADKDQLKQVFLNIGMNALEAMESGGKLTIECSVRTSSNQVIPRLRQKSSHDSSRDLYAVSDSAVVRIADTGTGMPKDQLDKIFEPFYTTKSSGTGLGLSIVRNIVREHKGTITVDSREDFGTVFTMEFPLIGKGTEMIKQNGRVNR